MIDACKRQKEGGKRTVTLDFHLKDDLSPGRGKNRCLRETWLEGSPGRHSEAVWVKSLRRKGGKK